ncbi:hypothetical protein [Pontibacter sp. HSC-36F09]|uniref:hypothetical protein n=1 Tax=Pontibacter sp. HSC-36F09 TaxID=2910966 RepID=UPI00209F1978|nr:hypothetical protein [Pontibacter sp. HSC-36F09]MCP2042970.1 hypothetical protein [Pontibacter sp. HSC-36F09]
MKLNKLLAAVVLSVGLSACGCEDVNLGKLEFTNELVSFMPAQPTQGKSYYMAEEGVNRKMKYINAAGVTSVEIPVRRTNYSGKFDPNSCKEFFTADQKVYASQVEGGSLVSISVTYRKNASTDRFNNITDKAAVGDVIEFAVGYNNKFPEPIQTGTSSSSNFITSRTFLFGDATTNTIDNHTYTQEFLSTVTLGGVQHQNVYHLYLNQPNYYRPEEQYIHDRYPALDYIQGIYVKEGFGIIQAYSSKGKEIVLSVN